MGGNKFISSEPKSGLSPEEMRNLGDKIDSLKNRIDELNGERLEIKAEMALKNKFISPEQEKELFDLVNSSEDLYKRYHRGERTEDLLAGLESYYQSFMQKRNEIFFDPNFLPKNEKADNPGGEFKGKSSSFQKQAGSFRDVREAGGTDIMENKIASAGEERAAKKTAKQKKEAGEKKIEAELKIDDNLIIRRAEEIKQKRLRGDKGFEGEKIDEILRRQGIEPMTPAAEEFMDKWDRNTAESELRKEIRKGEKKGGTSADLAKQDLEKSVSGKSELVPKKDIVGEASDFRAAEKEVERMKELARLGAEITLSKITNYEELWAQTEQEGDEKFKQKTRELWKEFAVHGKIGKKKDGKIGVLNFTDLDGNSSLGLLELAGISTKNLEHLEHGKYKEGKINVDTGERHGVILEDGGKTVFIDHHSDESEKDSSATKFTYDLLVSLGLLEKQDYLDRLVEFVTQEDNKNYPGGERYFKNYGRNLLGLKDRIKFKHLLEFFKEEHRPHEVLQAKELKKMELFKISKQTKIAVEKSLAELERIKDKGAIIETPRYGQIVVDLDKKIPFGFDAIRYAGYQTYLGWSPAVNSFFLFSVSPITDSFSQGKKIRGTMLIKPMSDTVPLTVTLKEVLTALTDGKLEPTGELAEFLEKEGQKKKAEQILPPEKMEIFEKVGKEFCKALLEGASWDGYSEEKKLKTLEIQTDVFLTKQLRKSNLVGEDKIAEVVESWVKKISG